MKKYLYMVTDKTKSFNLCYFYYPRTKAEQIAKDINKENRRQYGKQTFKAATKKIKVNL